MINKRAMWTALLALHFSNAELAEGSQEPQKVINEAIYFEGYIEPKIEIKSINLEKIFEKSSFPLYIIRPGDAWEKRNIKVCFLEKSFVSSKVAAVAAKWNGIANIELDFGAIDSPRLCSKKDSSPIRVSYEYWPPAGQWSLIGLDAAKRTDESLPTINLKYFDGKSGEPPREPYFTWIILHEFGHALGFQHEYRNPENGCDDEFNWDKIYSSWSKDDADKQLRQIKDSSSYKYGRYNPHSVMRYYYPPEYFRRGVNSPCYGEAVKEISDGDKEGLRVLYPE